MLKSLRWIYTYRLGSVASASKESGFEGITLIFGSRIQEINSFLERSHYRKSRHGLSQQIVQKIDAG